MPLNLKIVCELVQNFANEVRNQFPVSKVILYGSYAKGTATEESDVDVCFFLPNINDDNWFDISMQIFNLSHEYLDVSIEPRIYNVNDLEEDNFFLKEVLRTGIEIQ
jgi:predicted nucleotidyltransferase